MMIESALAVKRGRKVIVRRALHRGWARATQSESVCRMRNISKAEDPALKEYEEQLEKQRAESRMAIGRSRSERGFLGRVRETLRLFLPRRSTGDIA